MPNVLEAVQNLMKTFTDEEPKPPLHVGEVMSCWTYMATLREGICYVQVGLNTTVDHDLRGALHDSIKMCTSQVARLKKFMLAEGIPLPPVTEDKPNSETATVPLGVKLTDYEIANGVSAKIAAAIVLCATSASEAIRSDVGLMFIHFQAEAITYGATLKQLLRKRGWLMVPPPYYPPGLPRR